MSLDDRYLRRPRSAGATRLAPHSDPDPERATQMRADAAIAGYTDSIFPATPVPPPPMHARRLLAFLTGRPFSLRDWETYERVRAFCGYEGLELGVRHQMAQALVDPEGEEIPEPPPAPAAAPPTPPPAPASSAVRFDPLDLGD